MTRRRTLVVCPGRGSYDRRSLGSLQQRSTPAAAAIAACDAWRSEHGRPTVTELDADEAFRASRHVAGEHASLLTFAAGYADWMELNRDRYEVVGVAGNSMGWYTALAVSGALPLPEAIRLIDTMGDYQARNVIGGQVLYPVCDAGWAPSPALDQAVEDTLQAATDAGHVAEWSIRLGGYAVLGGDRGGVKFLLDALPAEKRGDRTFPLQLPLHSAFHTSLMRATSERARNDLSDLALRAPDVPLVDGRGRVFRPGWADPAALVDYTLGHQVVRPYDFTTSVVTALRHCAPEVVVCLGPGNPLGGPVARILVGEGWRAARTRGDLDALQQSDAPALLSFGVALQRPNLL